MPILIRNRALAEDRWRLLDGPAIDPGASSGDVIIPLALWLEQRAELSARHGATGVLLDGSDDPSRLGGDLATLPIIAVRFASFVDGRGYSSARLLRQRLGFLGELRAVGHVQRDQLSFMERCGFDSFLLLDYEDAQVALETFSEFSESYQAAVLPNEPLFRRRTTA